MACGGGGGDTIETIYVDFSYGPAQVSIRKPVSLTPSLVGLGNRQPQCVLSAGQLPPGVTLSSTTCVISGVTAAVGTYTVTVRLTSSGVQGFVDASAAITVEDPTPVIAATIGNDNAQLARWQTTVGNAWRVGDAVIQMATYTPQAGDMLTYRVASGALPPGLTIDAMTGAVGGTASVYGRFDAGLVATLRRNGADYASSAVAVSINVLEPGLSLAYTSCEGHWAEAQSCRPTTGRPLLPGSSLAFSASSVPPGFTLDAITGVLSGVPPTVVNWTVPITALWTLPDGRISTLSVDASITVGGVAHVYGTSPTVTGVATGPFPTNDGLGGVVVGLIANQPFTIPVLGIAGGRPGDLYGFELVQSDPNFLVPPWLSINPAQGTLTGMPPAISVGVTYHWNARLTTRRNGFTWVTQRNWSATVQ